MKRVKGPTGEAGQRDARLAGQTWTIRKAVGIFEERDKADALWIENLNRLVQF
jgi:hypothetical protein